MTHNYFKQIVINVDDFVYSNTKISLNIHRNYDDKTFQTNTKNFYALSPNNRIFDISASGGFQIADYREDINKFYKVGEEIVLYKDRDNLIDKIHYYMTNEDEREIIAEKAYQRTLNEHLFRNRLNGILKIIETHK